MRLMRTAMRGGRRRGRVRPDFEADLGTLRRMTPHSAHDSQRPLRTRLRTDGDERANRKIAGGFHRRHQPEPGQRNVLDLPGSAGSRVLQEAVARELDAPVTLIAYAAEYRELERAAEAFAGIELEIGIKILLPKIAGDLCQADERVHVAVRNRAVTMAREQSELRIDLGGETPQQ